jgi:tetratricopeptide (TPR) repeat protein
MVETATAESTATDSSWQTAKQLGKLAYDQGQYELALSYYSNCLEAHNNRANNHTLHSPILNHHQHHVCLNNMVACRLQLNDATGALVDARSSAALFPKNAKSHLCLAYALLLFNHNNQACNALQTCLRLDPKNATARNLLVQELSRQSTTMHNTPTVSTLDLGVDSDDDDDTCSQQTAAATAAHNSSTNWMTVARTFLDRSRRWYQSQTQDTKILWNVALVLVVLYISFGGRFGLCGARQPRHYSYDTTSDVNANTVYADYYNRQQERAQQQIHGGGRSHQHLYYGTNTYETGRTNHRDYSLGRTNPSGGTISILLVLVAVGTFVCRFTGVDPMYALLLFNRFRGGRVYVGRFQGNLRRGGFGAFGGLVGGGVRYR